MNRLTNKTEADTQRKMYTAQRASGCPRILSRERFLKLAAYEDSGLEPEEIENLVNFALGKSIAEVKEFDGIPVERLQQLARQEKEKCFYCRHYFHLDPDTDVCRIDGHEVYFNTPKCSNYIAG